MKKLKFLLIPLISLLFIINVNASTIDISYTDIKIVRFVANSTLINNARQFLIDNNYITDSSVIYYNWSFMPSYLQVHVLTDDYLFSNGYIWGNIYMLNYDSSNNISLRGSSYGRYTMGINSLLTDGYFEYRNGNGTTYKVNNNTSYDYILNSNNDIIQTYTNMNFKTFIDYISLPFLDVEPTYSYTSTILDNGNVKLDFTFTNYTDNSGYAFEIENSVNNEEYGITNTYSNIFPNQIPFGSSYSIELSYDSLLYVTLAKYEQVEQTSLYSREEIYTNIIDINNVVFENEQDPYFIIYTQNKNNITGTFVNTTNQMTCWYSYSDTQTEDYLPCDEEVGFNVHDNGYLEVIIKKGNEIIYSRKINYIGANDNEPYIIYQINKKDFYSIVVWGIENELSNTTYRYSTNNGASYTNWETYNNANNIINVFDNSTIIIEIANANQSTIYDSKAIVVVNDITTIKDINNTTINIINKFKNIFSVNPKILQNISSYYEVIRTSKIYLIIFIPFLTSLICAIIYLIRRK